jgi:SRSO17 transposase
MDGSWDQRKDELERECEVDPALFEETAGRLEEFMRPFLESYSRRTQAAHAVTVVQGLCSDLEAKNGESMAYLFGLDRKAIQHFVGESAWDDRPLRDELVRQVADELGEENGVIVFDPSGFEKSGKQSVGVARQWCGRLGKIDNCQVGVYMAYVSSQGHALVDVELSLPHEWTGDKLRMNKAGVPKSHQTFRKRWQLCLDMLDRYGDQLPHAWVTGDDEFGKPAEFRRELRDRGERYLLAVPCDTTIRDLDVPPPEPAQTGRRAQRPRRPSLRVDAWTAARSDDEWTRIDVRDGEQGPLIVEAIQRRVETGQFRATKVIEEVLVVIRYRARDERIIKTDYYLSNADPATSLESFCRVAKAEHRIEQCLQRAKSEAGLADYEVRNWLGWHHHQTLSLIATWFLTVETRRAEKKGAGDDPASTALRHRLDPPRTTRMRFAPQRHRPRATTSPPQPAGPLLPLEMS